MTCCKSLFLILSLSFLAACSMPKPQEKENADNGSATFYIASHSATYAETKLHPSISFAVGKYFSFKVCLSDKAKRKEVANHEFKIDTAQGERSLVSDVNGCLVWSELINYNAMAKATYVKWDRTIRAHGVQKGSVLSSFAINPWDPQEAPPVSLLNTDFRSYLAGSEAQEALSGTINGQLQRRPLWMNMMLIRINKKGLSRQGMSLEVELESTPQFEVYKKNGDRDLVNVRYGKFDVSLFVIHKVLENQQEVRRRLIKDTQLESEITSGSMYVTANLNLPQLCTGGQLLLGLKVTPINAPEQILPFEGIYTVGECDQIKGSFWGRLKNIAAATEPGTFKVEDYINDKNLPTVGENGKPNQDFYQQAKAEIKKLTFINKDMHNLSSLHRTRSFTVIACLRERLDQKLIKAQNFEVKTIDGRTVKLESNDDGCIEWDDSIDYYHLDQECWKSKNIIITNGNMEMHETIPVQINPWASSNFARDLRFTKLDKKQALCASGKSEIVIQRYDFDKKAYHYMVDPYLNLRVQKEGVLRIGARIKRPSLTDSSLSGIADEPLPPGPYLLRVGVVDMAIEDLDQVGNKVYFADEKPVLISTNSMVSESVTLETLNVKALGNTNQLVVELLPLKPEATPLIREKKSFDVNTMIDKTEYLAPLTFKGPLTLANNNEGATMEPANAQQQQYYIPALKQALEKAKQKSFAEMAVSSTKEFTAKALGLDLVNLNRGSETLSLRKSLIDPQWWTKKIADRESALPESPKVLTQWIDHGRLSPDLANRLCHYWIFDLLSRPIHGGKPALADRGENRVRLAEECTNQIAAKGPSGVFSISYRYFMKHVAPQVELQSSFVKDFSVSQSFSVSAGTSSSVSTSVGVDFGVGLKLFEFFGVLGGSVSGKVGRSWSWSENKGQQNSQTISSGLSGTFEKLQATITAENYEKCVSVKLASRSIKNRLNPLLSESDKEKILGKGLLICKGFLDNKPISRIENYFALNQRLASTQMLDLSADNNRPFFILMRGERDMSSLMALLDMELNSGTKKNVQTNLTSDGILNVMQQLPGSLPGQYVDSK